MMGNNEVFRDQFKGISGELVEVLGSMTSGSNLLIVGRDFDVNQCLGGHFDSDRTMITILRGVATLLNPHPETPVVLSSTDGSSPDAAETVFKRFNHKAILRLPFTLEDRDGSEVGMSALLNDSEGLFIRSSDDNPVVVRLQTSKQKRRFYSII